MKVFWFADMSAIGRDASTFGVMPSVAVVRAEDLGRARSLLRSAGLKSNWYRRASEADSRILCDNDLECYAWTTSDDDDWFIDESVGEYLRKNQWFGGC